MGEIGEQGVAPGGLVDIIADVAVEVAIRAFGDAERPVDVEGEVRLRFQIPFVRSVVEGPWRGRVSTSLDTNGIGWRRACLDFARHQRIHFSPSAASSNLNASARWLMACLACGSISPNVWSIPAATNIGS